VIQLTNDSNNIGKHVIAANFLQRSEMGETWSFDFAAVWT
jgi:hypothetical protein